MPNLMLSTECPFCRVGPQAACVTATGKRAPQPHAARYVHVRSTHRDTPSVYRMRADDTRFHLAEGDLLLCIPYPYDSKVTVLRRLSDGFNPECNQYTAAVEFVGWAADVLPADDTGATLLREAENAIRDSRATYANLMSRFSVPL